MNKKRIFSTLIYIAVVALVIFFAVNGVQMKSAKQEEISSADFIQKLENGDFSYVVVVNGSSAFAITEDNINKVDTSKKQNEVSSAVVKKYEYKAYITYTDKFEEILNTAKETYGDGFNYDTSYVTTPWYLQYLPTFVLTLIMIGAFYFIYSQSANGKGMQFGKSTAKMFDPAGKKVTFNDVAGADEEKEELAEIVGFLKDPSKYTKMGARIPRGVLLVGPPGTGKTLLAKSVAGEAGVPFFSITGSDFVELYVGIGAARVRDLFSQAKKNAPCIIFIDEIDAVGRQRGTGIGGGHDEREQTLNQLLVEMDGFVGNEGIIVMAATNRADVLDPALLRSGRFDRQVHVLPPDTKGREDIFKIHARNKHFAGDVSPHEVALLTSGFVGADIENLCNEAALLAVRRGQSEITMQDLKDSVTRVILGPEKKSHKAGPQQKKLVAYHEAGHAIVARSLPHCDPVTEVSVIPRGGAGGYTLTRPEDDADTYSRLYILDRITMCLGGRAAEKLILGDVSTGASSDIKHATDLAKGYVTKYGMCPEIGPIFLGDDEGGEIFLGRDFSTHKAYSEELASKVDKAIQELILNADKDAYDILKSHEQILHNLAEVLLDMEKITGEQFEEIYNGKTLADLKAETKQSAEESKAEEPTQQNESADSAEQSEQVQQTESDKQKEQ